VGFVIGKVVGPAVVRNRLRRRLRHVLRSRLVALPVGSRLVVRARPGAGELDSAALAALVDAALPRLVGAA
jgi:ribonuclease P protein component